MLGLKTITVKLEAKESLYCRRQALIALVRQCADSDMFLAEDEVALNRAIDGIHQHGYHHGYGSKHTSLVEKVASASILALTLTSIAMVMFSLSTGCDWGRFL